MEGNRNTGPYMTSPPVVETGACEPDSGLTVASCMTLFLSWIT